MKWKIFLVFLILWLGFLSLTGTLFSGYHFIDDHDVLKIERDISKSTFAREVRIFIKSIISPELRFRPIHQLHRRWMTYLLGSNFFAWSIYFAFLAGLTSYLLFVFADKLGFTLMESFIFVGLTLLGEQAAIWWKLGTNETIGMVFLSATLLFMFPSLDKTSVVKKRLFAMIFVILAIITSWCKESFVLLLPAFVFGRIYLTFHKEKIEDNSVTLLKVVRRNMVVGVVLLSVFLWELIHIANVIGTMSIQYAGYEGFALSKFLKTFWQSFSAVHGWIIIMQLIILMLVFFRPLSKIFCGVSIGNRKGVGGMIILAGLILLPQIVLYMKSGMVERYLLPGIIGYTLVIIVLFREVRGIGLCIKQKKMKRPIVGICFFILLMVICLQQIRVTRYTAIAFAREGRDINLWLQSIEKCTSTDDLLLVVTHPIKFQEASVSLKTYMDIEMNRRNIFYCPANFNKISGPITFWKHLNKNVIGRFPDFSFEDTNKLKEIKGILIFPSLEEQFLLSSKNWFLPENFKRYTNNTGYVSYYKKTLNTCILKRTSQSSDNHFYW